MPGFFKFKIKTKIILGYFPLVLVMIVIVVFSLISLDEANKVSKNIVERDIVLIEKADKMVDCLLSQESYGRRYVILESQEMLELFWQRSTEFEIFLNKIRTLEEPKNLPIEELANLHKEFVNLYRAWINHLGNPSALLTKEYDGKIKNKLDELTALIEAMVLDVRQNQYRQIFKTGSAGMKAFRITAILSSLGILLSIGAATLTSRNISRSIDQLKHSTKEISEGKFDHIPDMKGRDELCELASAFSEMTLRLARLEEVHLDANPLTRLPGGIAIENVLKNRLGACRPVALCLIDLDNFKSFNDRYGYIQGNEIIKTTAKIIEATIAEHGTGDDFVGHIGGDDFAVITTPERHTPICKSIIKKFNKKITGYYSPEDKARGGIIGETRQGQKIKFPIMTVSIAVATNNGGKQMTHIKIGEIAAELKKHAKSIPGSVFVVDRRGKEHERDLQSA